MFSFRVDLKFSFKFYYRCRFISVRVKDLTLIVLCVITVYLFRARETFVLRPEWRVDSEVPLPNKEHINDEILPRPIIVDPGV